MSTDVDDPPALSDSTLTALLAFYAEQNEEIDRVERLKSNSSNESEATSLSISDFKEDWHASQFWFTDGTAQHLAKELLLSSTPDSSIAIISAPSVYIQLRNLLSNVQYPTPARIHLLEYDHRFGMLDGYIKYDFNDPTQLPSELKGAFDQILWDPPYHSRACLQQYASTVEWLAKDILTGQEKGVACRKILCTGEVLEDAIKEVFPDLSPTTFRPQHTVRLDNRYACFANFELEEDVKPRNG